MNGSEEDMADDVKPAETFAEGVDFYFQDGLMVLTRHFLLKRGYCCESGCRNCPYGHIPDVSEQKDIHLP